MGFKRNWMGQAAWPWWMAAVWWQQLQWPVCGLGYPRLSSEGIETQRGETSLPLLCDDGAGCCTEQGGGWPQGEGHGSAQARGPRSWDPTIRDGCPQGRGQDPQGHGGEGAHFGQVAQVPGRASSILRPGTGELQEGPHAQPRGAGTIAGCTEDGLPGPQGRLRQPRRNADQTRAIAPGGSCGRMGTPSTGLRRRGRRHDRGDGREIGPEPQGSPCGLGAQNTGQACENSTPPRPAGPSRRSPLPSLDEFMETAIGIARRKKAAKEREEMEKGDPYMLSPSNRPPTMPSPPPRSTSRTRGTSRVPIKLKGRHPMPSPKPGSALARRLESKRKAVLEAAAAEAVQAVDSDDEDATLLGDLAGQTKIEDEVIE